MQIHGKSGALSRRLKAYARLLVLGWTACIAASLIWNILDQEEKVLRIVHNNTQTTLENDLLYRKWAARQGGLYVPVSEHTPPNPHLAGPDRDITTPSGLSLTLVNPAYMARQVNSMASGVRSSRGHITSLKPIRPENGPDPWEAAALKSFEEGAKEVSSLEETQSGEYFRLMRPFIAEESCLKCHGHQGYKAGSVRGGISVSVPMAPLRDIERHVLAGIGSVHLFLWRSASPAS